MSNFEVIDIKNWNRKPQYEFFKTYDLPYFNLTAHVEVERLWRYARANGLSFALANLFCATKVANEIEAFRYRLRGHQVIRYDVVHAGTTVLYDDKTFGFCYVQFQDDLFGFCADGAERMAAQKQSRGFDPRTEADDLIHYSFIPWVAFTGLQHARKLGGADAVPKISFGKYQEIDSKLQMPVSVEAHHALMDGYHVGQFFEKYQTMLHAFGA